MTQRYSLASLATLLLSINVEFVHGQGDYAPVTNADVLKVRFNHYFTAVRKLQTADFEWTFTPTDFVLKKSKAGLPADLIAKLLPQGKTADEMHGKWRIEEQNSQRIILSDIKVGAFLGNPSASFPVYRTAPTVVRIGQPQYAFAISRLARTEETHALNGRT